MTEKFKKEILILIVEDEAKLVKALEMQLRKDGFEVGIAFDGAEAVEFCNSHAPDFILLDLLLPKVSGIDFLKKIKKDSRLKDIPVLILTNLTDEKTIVESKGLGVLDYLIKSNVSLNDIIDIIKKYFKIN